MALWWPLTLRTAHRLGASYIKTSRAVPNAGWLRAMDTEMQEAFNSAFSSAFGVSYSEPQQQQPVQQSMATGTTFATLLSASLDRSFGSTTERYTYRMPGSRPAATFPAPPAAGCNVGVAPPSPAQTATSV